eukprot:CFRG4921T1
MEGRKDSAVNPDNEEGLMFVVSHPNQTVPPSREAFPVPEKSANLQQLSALRPSTVPHVSSVPSGLNSSTQRRFGVTATSAYRGNLHNVPQRNVRPISPSQSGAFLDTSSEGVILLDGEEQDWVQRSIHRGSKENMALLEALKAAQAGVAESSLDLQATFTILDSERKCRKFVGKAGFLNVDFESLIEKGFFWMDVCSPGQPEMSLIENVFGLHPLTSEDVLTEYTREKVEVFDRYLFTIMQTFASTKGENEQSAVNFNVAVFDTFALTFHAKPVHVVDTVVVLMQSDDTPLRADWALMLIIDNIADELEPIARAAEIEVDAIDEMIFYLGQRDAADILRRITHIRRRTSRLIRTLKPKRDILLYLTGHGRNPPPHVKKDTFLYFRDVLDLIHEMMGKIENSRETINSTHSNYLAQLNVELAEATAKSGTALNSLTVVSTLFLPLNLIAGSFGMNVTVPFQDTGGLLPFFGIVIAMCMLSAVSIFWAKRMRIM